MGLVVLFVLTDFLFVAEDDLADGDRGEHRAPRAVGRVVTRRVLTCVAGGVAEVVGNPACLENVIVSGFGCELR